MTDEQRLGLPEEPECCNARRPSMDGVHEIFSRRAWGAAWREKALELEKERDELLQKLRELEKERNEVCPGDVPETDFGNSVEEIPHDPR